MSSTDTSDTGAGPQIRKLRHDATDEEFANLQRQVALLDAKCPRYDVYNVFSALNPMIIASDTPWRRSGTPS